MAILTFALLFAPPALADGGAVQFSRRSGNLQFTVMADPTPLRVGTIDISILIQAPHTGGIPSTGRTLVILRQLDEPALQIQAEATAAAATNKLLRSAQIDIPRRGRWQIEIQHTDNATSCHADGELQVADKPPRYRQAAGWILLPLFPIGLYVVGELLAARKRGSQPAV